MKKIKRHPMPVGEMSVLPVMNVMFMLIPALLLAMEVASLAAITVTPPRIASGGAEPVPTRPSLQLDVRVAADGFWVSASQAPVGEIGKPTVGMRTGDTYDYAGLEAVARELAAANPEERTVYVTAEGDVPLQVLVRTMDALRGSDCKLSGVADGEPAPADCLFWHPVIRSL